MGGTTPESFETVPGTDPLKLWPQGWNGGSTVVVMSRESERDALRDPTKTPATTNNLEVTDGVLESRFPLE